MHPRKILIVDDSKLIHKMFEVMLRQHRLVHAENGREGIQELAQHADVELVLLDINMPQMNGLEFLAEVKGNPALADIPVVVVSTEGKEEDTRRALELGANEYIKKPFDSAKVLDVVTRLTAKDNGE